MTRVRASEQDGSYPRPQHVRSHHCPLDRTVGFAYDDEDRGRDEHWEALGVRFEKAIRLPFPPESPASGINDTGFHPVVWYRIPVTRADLETAGWHAQGDRVLLHFGAVDYRADVWVDGTHVTSHEGGQSPFSADVTNALDPGVAEHEVVVRAEDDPFDLTMPRGKQDWAAEPHAIWYQRTTGIWQTVWLEAVPATRVERIAWIGDVVDGGVRAEIELSRRPSTEVEVEVGLHLGDDLLVRLALRTREQRFVLDLALPERCLGQSYQSVLWSPEHPRLIDAHVVLRAGDEVDEVDSYLGLRRASVEHGRFVLNNHPYFVRSVLEQGYWPESHLAAPSGSALRREVELIKSLGFNAARIHQKVEDPRFHFWADRLGLLLWGETAGAYRFSAPAIERLSREWVTVVRRDLSHPSIVTWVPFNESWGIQQVSYEPAQRAYSAALTCLTRAIDPTRPVVSNDGWEHTDSDIWSIHDYEASGEVLRARYLSRESIGAMLDGFGPAGRILSAGSGARTDRGQAVMLTEFGGVRFDVESVDVRSWGYSTAADAEDFQDRLEEILDAVNGSPVISGFCYTQLTDTRQETNGLCDENRVPKLPAETIARIVQGPAAGDRR